MPRTALVLPQEAICRPHWWTILTYLKQSLGKSVKEISTELKMSYMGAYRHVEAMEKQKLICGVRNAQKTGRPQTKYLLTKRAQVLFAPAALHVLTEVLQSAAQMFDQHAPEKLILRFFQREQQQFLSEMEAGSILERAHEFALLRKQRGYFSCCSFSKNSGLCVDEYEHPLREVIARYPAIVAHEKNMVEALLGNAVKRKEKVVGSHKRVRWYLPTI